MNLFKFKYSHLIFIITILVTWTIGIIYYSKYDLFFSKYLMSITMLFGSFIAGATSEGGGAIAFPVMTLIFKLSPSLARDYTFIIQSFGMTSASIFILSKKIPIEARIIPFVLLGALPGCAIGLSFLEGLFAPTSIKLFFVTLWLCFGLKLLFKNRQLIQQEHIPNRFVLIFIGFIGGLVTSLIGSGVDIITFSILGLFYGLNEKSLTPTSVIIMSITSIFGSLWKILILNSLSPAAVDYWWVTVPICIIGAPLGAYTITFFSVRKIIFLLFTSIVIQYIAALLILKITILKLSLSLTIVMLFAIWIYTRVKNQNISS